MALDRIPAGKADAELEDESEFPEGRELERIHKVKERSAKLVRSAKRAFLRKHAHLFCQVCGFDFEEHYGELGRGFIEAHHTAPLAELNESSRTRIEDLELVCSNCPRMLHRKRPWLTAAHLIELLAAATT